VPLAPELIQALVLYQAVAEELLEASRTKLTVPAVGTRSSPASRIA
jgi:hypothetical protein